MSTRPSASFGSTAAKRRAIAPPIELPTTITVPVASSEVNLATVRRRSMTRALRSPSGLRPKPGKIHREDSAQARQPGRHLDPVQVHAAEPVDEHERRLGRPVPLPVDDRPVEVDRGKRREVDAHGARVPPGSLGRFRDVDLGNEVLDLGVEPFAGWCRTAEG